MEGKSDVVEKRGAIAFDWAGARYKYSRLEIRDFRLLISDQ